MKLSKKILAAALVAAVASVSPAAPCYAWTSGSSSGLFQHYGTQDRADVKIWVTSGDPTELQAHVYTTQRYKGGTQLIYREKYDYNESTYSAIAVRTAESGYRIVSYSGDGKVKGVLVETVGTTLV